jgi:transposase
MRQQLLDAIYSGQPFRQALRDFGLTPNPRYRRWFRRILF